MSLLDHLKEALLIRFVSVKRFSKKRDAKLMTDELIDATVYRLYGLTEVEIGIVEGNANENA